MLKDTEKKENNSTHFTYNDYKDKVNKTPKNKDFMVFISVFLIGVLIILGFAKILSPNVDVGIANDEEFSQAEDSLTGAIDERLRSLQREDSARIAADEEMFSPELDEKVVLPKQVQKTVGEMEAEMHDTKAATQKADEPVKEVEQGDNNSPAELITKSQTSGAKVVVGYYATEKQAEVAKSIIQDAGLGVTPFVKNMGSYYTLQVGSYSSQEKAQQAANNLLKNNFPARVVVE